MVSRKRMETSQDKEEFCQNTVMIEPNNNADGEETIDMESWYSNNMSNIRVGEVVKGEIIEINEDSILVDIKYKSEGVISREEFGNSYNNFKFKVGDSIDVFLENTEDQNGRIVLSKRKADYYFAWDKIANAYTHDEPVKGRVLRRVKGGLQVDINGIYAFLPASQIDLNQRQDLDSYIGKEIEMKIIKLNRVRNNIVLSRRIILEEKRNKNRIALLKDLTEGQIRKGIVKNITNFGAFIDLGGIDGLLHITDISWGRISHPSEVLHVGQEIDVKILSFDKDNRKVSLGLKQKTENPWNTINDKYKLNDKVKGKVVSIADYGAFIELEEGVEGLLHLSEMSWTKRIEHPSEIVKIGESIEVVLLNSNKEEKKIALGLKQTQPNPWNRIEQEFPAGTKIKRKIKNIVDFGIFIELVDSIDGLIHISDFSWTKHYNNAHDVYKKDNEIEAVVLSIDKENQRISLGIKQLETNPWEHLRDKYKEGSNHKVKIIKFFDTYAIAELEKDIEGIIQISQVDTKDNRKLEEIYSLGDEIMVKIIKLNIDEHKINLSPKAFIDEQEKNNISEYINSQKKEIANLGDIIGNNSSNITEEDNNTSHN
ncbi:MAG: 30S ribosomal protein S1 [Candidatus Firestonebacteria bacterium]|nr:30S ribosomal protein S1 [Candidatus Firestonebacteria bacterium]